MWDKTIAAISLFNMGCAVWDHNWNATFGWLAAFFLMMHIILKESKARF